MDKTIDYNYSCFSVVTISIVDDEAAEQWLQTSMETIIYTFLIPAVVGLGLLGNIAFLVMVRRLPRMKTTVNFYLVNLAITDTVFLSTQSSFVMYGFFKNPLRFSHPFKTSASCNCIFFIGYLSYYCSVSLITLVSIERYFAICKPFTHRRMQSKSHTLKTMGTCWSVSIVLTVATLLKRGKIVEYCLQWPKGERYANMPTVFRFCGPVGGYIEIVIFMEILYIVLFFIAAFVNGFLFTKIIIALSSRSVSSHTNVESQNISVRNQVARALVINGIIFFITQTPFRINDITEILETLKLPQFLTPDQKAHLLSFAIVFLYLNSALNPYVYAFSSSNYRKGFLEAFTFSHKQLTKPDNNVALKSINIQNEHSNSVNSNGIHELHCTAQSHAKI